MADNVAITAGAGTNIATDDVSGNHYQRVKLTDGTVDSATVVAAGEGVKANALRVVLPTDAADVKVTLDSETVTLAAGSNNIGDVDVASLPADVAIADDAAFSVGSSKCIAQGYMLDDTSTDTVNEGDIGIARMTADRRQIVAIGETGSMLFSGTASTTGGTATTVISGTSSQYMYVTSIVVHNSSTTDTYVTIKGSTSGDKLVLPAPAKGGAVMTFPTPLRLGTAAENLQFTPGTGVTTMYCSAVGYKSVV